MVELYSRMRVEYISNFNYEHADGKLKATFFLDRNYEMKKKILVDFKGT